MTELFTALLVVITGFYAWVTFKILKANEGTLSEMRRQQEDFHRPYVSIFPEMYEGNPCFFLKIKNTGRTAAQNLRLTLDKDFYKFADKRPDHNLKTYNAFTETIDSFVPEAEMLFYLAQGFVVFGKKADENITPSTFSIFAEYEYTGKKVIEKTTIDLRPYLDSAIPQNPIARNIKELKETIDKKKLA